jgi:hypothetical protein
MKKRVEMKLVACDIGPKNADKEFRESMKNIMDFWNENKHDSRLKVPPYFYDLVIKLRNIKPFYRLKGKWEAKLEQNLTAYYTSEKELTKLCEAVSREKLQRTIKRCRKTNKFLSGLKNNQKGT